MIKLVSGAEFTGIQAEFTFPTPFLHNAQPMQPAFDSKATVASCGIIFACFSAPTVYKKNISRLIQFIKDNKWHLVYASHAHRAFSKLRR